MFKLDKLLGRTNRDESNKRENLGKEEESIKKSINRTKAPETSLSDSRESVVLSSDSNLKLPDKSSLSIEGLNIEVQDHINNLFSSLGELVNKKEVLLNNINNREAKGFSKEDRDNLQELVAVGKKLTAVIRSINLSIDNNEVREVLTKEEEKEKKEKKEKIALWESYNTRLPEGTRTAELPENIKDFKCLEVIDNKSSVWCLQALADKQIISGDSNACLKIWEKDNTNIYQEKLNFEVDTGINALQAISDKFIITGHQNGEMYINEKIADTWQKIPLIDKNISDNRAHADWVRTIHYLEEDNLLVSGGDDKKIKIWEKNKGGEWELKEEISSHENWIVDLQILPDGKIAAADTYGEILIHEKVNDIWQSDKLIDKGINRAHEYYIRKIQVLPPEDRLVSAGDDNRIKIWEKDKEKGWIVENTITSHKNNIRALQVLINGTIVSGDYSGKLFVHRQINGEWDSQEIFDYDEGGNSINAHSDIIYSLQVVDNRIITGSRDGKIKVWGLEEDS